jgi:hypothetical protein
MDDPELIIAYGSLGIAVIWFVGGLLWADLDERPPNR